MEIRFGLELSQSEEGLAGMPCSSVQPQLPAERRRRPQGLGVPSRAHLSQLKTFCSTFQNGKLRGRRYETYPTVYRKGKPSHHKK